MQLRKSTRSEENNIKRAVLLGLRLLRVSQNASTFRDTRRAHLVVGVLGLLVVEAGGLLVVTSLGVQGRSLLAVKLLELLKRQTPARRCHKQELLASTVSLESSQTGAPLSRALPYRAARGNGAAARSLQALH
jgi:hypothetical protein